VQALNIIIATTTPDSQVTASLGATLMNYPGLMY
jgi:hypothetical protein